MSEAIARSQADYQRLSSTLPGHASRLAALREQALGRFAEHGYPTPREEAWKYTNLAPFALKSFEPLAAAGHTSGIGLGEWLLDEQLPRLVFVDGHFAPALSAVAGLPEGATVSSLAAVMDGAAAEVEHFLATHVPTEPRGFAELNTAFMSDGVFLRLEEGVTVERPIHVLHIARGGARPTAAYLRHLVFCARGSRATLIEHYVSVAGAQAVTSAMTQCVLEDGAALEHYKLNEQGDGVYHFAGVHVHQSRDSQYTSHNVQAGGRIARSDLHATLSGQGAGCVMNGLYLGRDRQTIDNCTWIDHEAPGCTSRELYRGVLDGHARGIFNGHAVVRQQAQHTDAQQTNHNLLLSDDAEANTRPQLVIYADDVKCSHGSTVGQLDRDALFYLRARGIGEADARAMLVRAFADDIIDRMGFDPVRRRLAGLVAERLA